MKATARKLDPSVAHQDVLRVVQVGPEIEVASIDGAFTARRAASCLIAPEVGDDVLVAFIPGRPCYVLAVLEREAAATARLEVEGDLAIHARGGRVSVSSSAGLDLVTEGPTNVVASDVNVRATRGSVVLDSLALIGRAVVAEVVDAKLLAKAVETVAERVVERAKRVYRFVDDLDQLRAARVDHAAESTLSLRAKNTVITADQLVKLDGDQIHVG
jgi:hypothetical protein